MSVQSPLYISLGSGHVSLAEFGPLTSSGATLKAYYEEPLDYDFLDEDQWLSAAASALRRLVSFNKISGSAHVILPGFVLLAKAIKVPHVDPSRQTQIIAFEAQQNIPYPLHEVVWTYQIVHDDGVEADVLLVAIKADMAESICRMLEGLKLEAVSLLASPVLDYNAYRFNRAEDEEEFLLVNVGMKNTNLVFGSANNLALRNVAIGGNALTQAIANNLGKNFTEAEALKVSYYSTEEPDPDHEFAAVFASNSETFVRRIQSDITRSLANYKRQKQGKGPSRIVLTGRGSLVPGLAELLGEKLAVPVEYFNPLEKFQLAPSVDQDLIALHGFQVGELVGALVAIEQAKALKLDLLPDELVSRRRFQRQKPLYLAAAFILGASFIYPWMLSAQAVKRVEAEEKKIQNQIRPLQAESSAIQGLQTSITREENLIASLQKVAASLYNWNDFLIDLQQRLVSVEDIWIESLEVQRQAPAAAAAPARGRTPAPAAPAAARSGPMVLSLEGRVVDRENPLGRVSDHLRDKVDNFISTMSESPYLQEVKLDLFDDSQPGILRFEFTISIHPEKPL